MPSEKNKIVIAFDLYGTILSTESVARDLAAHFGGDRAPAVAASWRRYQLEYTWRIRSMGAYAPFDAITRASLRHAVEEHGLACPAAAADALVRAYRGLAVFPDVPPALEAIRRSRRGGGGGGPAEVRAVVLSNGTGAMLSESVAASPDLAPFQSGPEGAVFERLISVHDLGTFKPDPRVYEHLQAEAAPGDWRGQAATWLVSANAFDVVGARAAGLRAAWVDRAGTGWVDRLGDVVSGVSGGKRDLSPTLVVAGVDQAVEQILKVGI